MRKSSSELMACIYSPVHAYRIHIEAKLVYTPPTLLPMAYLEQCDVGSLGPTAPCSYHQIIRDAVVSCC